MIRLIDIRLAPTGHFGGAGGGVALARFAADSRPGRGGGGAAEPGAADRGGGDPLEPPL